VNNSGTPLSISLLTFWPSLYSKTIPKIYPICGGCLPSTPYIWGWDPWTCVLIPGIVSSTSPHTRGAWRKTGLDQVITLCYHGKRRKRGKRGKLFSSV